MDTILKIMGTPSVSEWREGYKLAQKRNIKLETMSYKKKNLKSVIANLSDEAVKVLKKMLKVNPVKRYTARQLLEEPYFKNFQLKSLIDKVKSMTAHVRTIEVKSEHLPFK